LSSFLERVRSAMSQRVQVASYTTATSQKLYIILTSSQAANTKLAATHRDII